MFGLLALSNARFAADAVDGADELVDGFSVERDAGLEKFGDGRVRFEQDGDDAFLLYHRLLDQRANLGLGPSTVGGGFREKDESQVALGQSFLDGLDEVFSRTDFPFVSPRVDTVLPQVGGDS